MHDQSVKPNYQFRAVFLLLFSNAMFTLYNVDGVTHTNEMIQILQISKLFKILE